MPQNEPAELTAIRQASDGLEYPSESDTPFDAFYWEARPGETLEQLIGSHVGPRRRIEEMSVDAFFSPLAQTDDAEQFQSLRRTIENNLTDLRIFRVGVGGVELDVYILGKGKGGGIYGLHTTSVET